MLSKTIAVLTYLAAAFLLAYALVASAYGGGFG
jgi:hypothetical protein